MRTAPLTSNVFTITLLVALCAHAAVILTANFDYLRDRARSVPTSLDVILVQWASEKPPEQADFLAQATQRGGGDSPEPDRPVEPLEMPAEEWSDEVELPLPVEPAQYAEAHTDQSASTVLHTRDRSPDPLLAREAAEDEDVQPARDAERLLQQGRLLARSLQDPVNELRAPPDRPRRKFISANTQEHVYAAYMRNWVAKVERVGNLNYPEAARRANLDGSLMLRVDVRQDGSVERIDLLRSSGHEVLDEAAMRIVRLSAPFAPLPPEVAREVDILTITRTWQFSSQRGARL